MKANNRSNDSRLRWQQRGVVTTFTGILILVLLTLMMFFAIRVGVFEQRVSSSEARQKLAFHAAESGIQNAKEYFKANAVPLASSIPAMLGDGTDGWRTDGSANKRWERCSDAGLDLTGSGTHPCFAEPNVALRESGNLYYWSYNGSLNLPVQADGLLPDGTQDVTVQALLCLINVGVTPQDCNPDPVGDVAFVDGSRYLVTVLARGQADCGTAGCGAEAVIREQVANFGGAAGGQAPAVPLTTKNMFPPSGAAEIVANPNGGGVGVPISVWMNGNSSCTVDGSTINPSQGSWATCEAHEWYELEQIPDGVACPGSCSCAFQESLSYTHGSDDILGIDLVQDTDFPCDLFQFYFGAPRTNFEQVKGFAKVLTDCDGLGPHSSGIYWISGSKCDVGSNVVIGSPDAPVLLISAATVTRMAGGATIFGVLYVSDVEDITATFESQGNNIVYGQVILDAQFGTYNGTFQVIYNQNLITRVAGTGGLGNVLGGWSDFHPDAWDFSNPAAWTPPAP
ncbi:MAG: hypothetical protein RQ826_04110 [Xanthomonadales bacterium]|nr:hypothetical protein [Xanthomonadales bacterium]